MGNYVNNTEAGFQSIVNTGMYVDKTGLSLLQVLTTIKKVKNMNVL